jgi:hypothetical protein
MIHRSGDPTYADHALANRPAGGFQDAPDLAQVRVTMVPYQQVTLMPARHQDHKVVILLPRET